MLLVGGIEADHSHLEYTQNMKVKPSMTPKVVSAKPYRCPLKLVSTVRPE